jgi:uncharacterized protein (DUF2164 family)
LADQDNPTRFKLSEERRASVLSGLKKLYHNEFDEELSDFQAEEILAYFIKALGPPVYNQAIGDARAFMTGKLEDLDVEFYEPESNE